MYVNGYFGKSGNAAGPFRTGSKASSVSLMPFAEHSTVMEQPQTIQSINGGTQMWAFYINPNSCNRTIQTHLPG